MKSMFVVRQFAAPDRRATDILPLPHDRRAKSRQNFSLPGDESILCQLPPGVTPHDGAKLLAENESGQIKIIQIEAASESLIEARAAAMLLARAAWHLGNRHVALEIGEDAAGFFLRFPLDHVLEAMLAGLGCATRRITAPFNPEEGAYAGHRHGGGQSGAMIHGFK
ncbi:MAG: urease accessory protein UreE [Desulfobulbaceae bacterium]|jgi:urease accessory protein|nr:urease accessory protein UreE [Desulfobulbaceae bacterium]